MSGTENCSYKKLQRIDKKNWDDDDDDDDRT